MLPIAHVGHWLLWVLYAVPIAIVLGSIAITMVRDRRGDEPPVAADDPRPARSTSPPREAGSSD